MGISDGRVKRNMKGRQEGNQVKGNEERHSDGGLNPTYVEGRIKKVNGWEMHEGRTLVIGISDGKDEGEIRGNQKKGKEKTL